jgi:probable F420-dependent oxidoreductase
MQIGVMFPQNEIGPDVDAVCAFTKAAEDSGCRHLWITDHVVGADRARRPDWQGTYALEHEFHEPLMLLAYLAAISQMEFVTGIIILPQRQTVLVAKQAAELDLLSRGRLRLGVGIGWNPVEYEALGMGFTTRGRRMEEQIGLLRRLWTEPSVDFEGEFDVIHGAGLTPLPLQRPIPIWIGAGTSEVGLRRIGRLADGYLAQNNPSRGTLAREQLELVREAAREAGRDPASLGVQGLLPTEGKSRDEIRRTAELWRELGATHLTIDPRAVSLHVNTEVSMEEKMARSRSSLQRLIDNVHLGTEALAAG